MILMNLDLDKSQIFKLPNIDFKNEGIIEVYRKVYLGDFLDDLFKKNLVNESERKSSHPIFTADGKSLNTIEVVLRLLPDEWIKNKNNLAQSVSKLRTGGKTRNQGVYKASKDKNTEVRDFFDYKIGNDITEEFVLDPEKCKTKLLQKVKQTIYSKDIIFNIDAFKAYIIEIINLNFPEKVYDSFYKELITEFSKEEAKQIISKIKFDYEKRFDNYIGSGKSKKKVIGKIEKLLDLSLYEEILALFLLSFIILQKYNVDIDPDKNELALWMIWFNSDELTDNFFENSFKKINTNDYELLFCYAKNYYEHCIYNVSYKIIESIRNCPDKPDVRINYYILYIEHILLGKGVKKDILKAFQELLHLLRFCCKKFEKLESDVQIELMNKVLFKLREILSQKYGNPINNIKDLQVFIYEFKSFDNIKIENIIEFENELFSFIGNYLLKYKKQFIIKESEDLNSDNKKFMTICYQYAIMAFNNTKEPDKKGIAKSFFEFISNLKIKTDEKIILNIIYESEEYLKCLGSIESTFPEFSTVEYNFRDEKRNATNRSNNLCDYLAAYKLSRQIDDFNLSGISFKQKCCVINCDISSQYFNGITTIDCKIVNLFNEKDLGSSVLTALDNYNVKFYFFSEDNEKNLNDSLELIDRLYKYICLNYSYKDLIINNIDIYVKANFDYASMLIDSNLNMMNDEYFKIHICDYDKLSAQQLLIGAPLFIPYLIDKSDIDVVIFGTNDSTFELVKQIVAIAYTNNIPRITLLGKEAHVYRKKLERIAPGIYKEPENLNRIKPEFYNFDVEITDFIDLLTNYFDDAENLIKSKLQRCNYFVIDLGNDRDNIIFATKLRGWILCCDNKFKRTPFIAVKCENSRNADIARHLIVNNKKAGNEVYNNYNLYFYGMKGNVFSSEFLNIEENKQQQMALNVHRSYYGENIPDKDSVIKSYFKFSYNRDSSECKSISLMYMFFSLGIIDKLSDLNLSEDELAKAFNEWIKKEGNLNAAARYEHSRWVGFMLSRGWRSASLEQIKDYAGQESGDDHKHLLCKLHPFICNWDDFSDGSEEDIKIKELKSEIKNLRSPIDSTKEIIMATGKILTQNLFKNQMK